MMNDVGLAYRDGNPLGVGCTSHMWSTDGVEWQMSSAAASNASIPWRALEGNFSGSARK